MRDVAGSTPPPIFFRLATVNAWLSRAAALGRRRRRRRHPRMGRRPDREARARRSGRHVVDDRRREEAVQGAPRRRAPRPPRALQAARGTRTSARTSFISAPACSGTTPPTSIASTPTIRRRSGRTTRCPTLDATSTRSRRRSASPIPRLRWLAYHREVDTGTHYMRWLVPKRDGSPRLISAPKPDLKARAALDRARGHRAPAGARRRARLPRRPLDPDERARPRAARSIVVKLDIRGFYPTVTCRRVKGLLRRAGLGEQVATLMALLATESPREEVVTHGKTLLRRDRRRARCRRARRRARRSRTRCACASTAGSPASRASSAAATRATPTTSRSRGTATRPDATIGTLLRAVDGDRRAPRASRSTRRRRA